MDDTSCSLVCCASGPVEISPPRQGVSFEEKFEDFGKLDFNTSSEKNLELRDWHTTDDNILLYNASAMFDYD